MHMLGGVALIGLLTGCAAGYGEDGASSDASAPAFSEARLKTDTKTLSSDEFEGRAPMTEGETKTVAYISKQFAEAGLQPGANGSWFQDVPLVQVTANPAKADIRFTGPGTVNTTLKYGDDEVIWTKRVQPSVFVENSPLVFVGYGVVAPEKGWNDYAGLDMAGKTAVILVNDPDWQTEGLEGDFGGRAMTYYGRWTYKYEEAARQGAAGAIIIHDTEPAAYGWATVENSWTGPQVDMDRPDKGKDRVAVEGWIQKSAAEKLFEANGLNLAEQMAAAGKRGFKAVPLETKMSAMLENEIRQAQSQNVVGILPGTTRPEEYVLYSAHWDHLGICKPDAEDKICNGALDNASGTAGLMELARVQAEAGAADRSIVFLAVTGEESGLLGSAYYAADPVYPLSQTVAGINMDGLNIGGLTKDVVVVGAGKSELEDYLKREVAKQDRRIDLEPNPEAGSFYRSDHFSLAKLGVPTLYAESGVDLVEGGKTAGQAASDDYRANRYHMPTDEYDPNWNWDGAIQDLTIYFDIGRELANSTAWPNWYEGDEFRAVRDQSRAGAGAGDE